MRLLKEQERPLTGSHLAGQLGVSRQVIVQDIALLKTKNPELLSTHRGYILQRAEPVFSRVYWVAHEKEQIEDELNTIVDYGGVVKNVIVDHALYGMITVDLVLKNRKDVRDFVQQVQQTQARPLKAIAHRGEHGHLVEAEEQQLLLDIEKELRTKGYLVEDL